MTDKKEARGLRELDVAEIAAVTGGGSLLSDGILLGDGATGPLPGDGHSPG